MVTPQAPRIHSITDPKIAAPEEVEGVGIPAFVFRDFNSRLCVVDLVFDAGYSSSLSPVVPDAVSQLILTATSRLNAEEISNAFDRFGAYTQCSTENHYTRITLFVLDKYLDQVLALFVSCFNDQVFDEKELAYYKLRKIQSLKIASQKTSYAARKQLNESMFGASHFMGITATRELTEKLSAEECEDFFNTYYSLKYLVLTGPFTDELIQCAGKNIAVLKSADNSTDGIQNTRVSSENLYIEIPKAEAVQCTLAMGAFTIPFSHPDYIPLQITNTLLGGFFGSRLMKNIREEKGYTYGISSTIFSMQDFSILAISADVKKETYKYAIDEIFKEIDRLKTEEVSTAELGVLQSYLQGSIIHKMDNLSALAGMFISLREKNADMSYYLNYFNTLSRFSNDEVARISATYLLPKTFYTVVAGT